MDAELMFLRGKSERLRPFEHEKYIIIFNAALRFRCLLWLVV